MLTRPSRLFDYYSDEDDEEDGYDNEDGVYYSRGTVSDHEIMPESDFLSGNEEQGYEVRYISLRMIYCNLSHGLVCCFCGTYIVTNLIKFQIELSK